MAGVVASALRGGRTNTEVAMISDAKSRHVMRILCFVTSIPFPHENVRFHKNFWHFLA